VRTFAGLPQLALSEAATAGATIVGAPFDTATSWRPGARFGPEAIRSASTLLRPWHPQHAVDVFATLRAHDAGDIALTPGNATRSAEQIADALAPVCAADAVPVVLGGDHSILLGELRAHASARGPLALVLLDAHADTWEDYYGERLFHGTVLRRAAEEGVLDARRSLIAGVRGPLYEAADLDAARELGFELIPMQELAQLEPVGFAARVRARVGDAPAHLGVDMDVLDPSAAPGTGTPEAGGLLARELLALLRALAGMRFAGFDVVEVSPPYDTPAQITALLAANIAYEMLALAAVAALAAPRRGA
jgi:agmatinase